MAKFKKGDHVKVIRGPWKGYHGSVATPKTDAGKVEVTLSKGGGHIQMSFFTEDELAANSCLNAKFKKGDIVLDRNGEWYQVKDIRGDGFIAIRMPSGSWEYRDPKDFKLKNSCVSTNPIVQNALMARNAVFDVNGKQLNKGDKVKIAVGNLPDAKKGESGVVTWVWTDGSNGVDVRLASGKTCSYKGTAFAKNAVSANAVDPLDALNSAETKMREAIGELGKVTDPDLRQLASRIATKLKAVQGELRRELAV